MATNYRDSRQYLASLETELSSQADRVRSLIGAGHWGHDGRHKEQLLTAALRSHMPHGITLQTGFVIGGDGSDCSREQDILAIDTRTEAPVFAQAQLAIAFPSTVLASISVKTTLDLHAVRSSCESFLQVFNLAAGHGIKPERLWCGLYAFGPDLLANHRKVFEAVLSSVDAGQASVLVNGVPQFAPPVSVMSGPGDRILLVDYISEGRLRMRAFATRGVSTAIFIAHLADHIAVSMGAVRAGFADFVPSSLAELIDTIETDLS